MILFHRETVDLELAARLVGLLRRRALVDQCDPEHRGASGYYYVQAKRLGLAVARARRAQTVGESRS